MLVDSAASFYKLTKLMRMKVLPNSGSLRHHRTPTPKILIRDFRMHYVIRTNDRNFEISCPRLDNWGCFR